MERLRTFPIDQHSEDIIESIIHNPFTIVVGAPGSGKTTRLPRIIYDNIDLQGGQLGVTQPRRLATTSTARFVAREIGSEVGAQVGYRIRRDNRTSQETEVKFMTDGMLVSELMGDPYLERYAMIMIDEVHERSITIDLLLGWLKRLTTVRPEFRVIIASATIDLDRFVTYLPDANIIEVGGRAYPVTIHWHQSDMLGETELAQAAIDRAAGIHASADPGDVLIFAPDMAMINHIISGLESLLPSEEALVLPAHGSLAPDDIQRILEPSDGRRKIVVATNIAETSITIDGIVYVIDTGLIKANQFNPRSGLSSLAVQEHSQAGVIQRAGRAGRTQPGVCYRLYTEDNFHLRPVETAPEIHRTSLDNLLLRLLSLGVHDPRTFDFIEAPDQKHFDEAHATLVTLGAIDHNGTLTELGKQMARLPLDASIARMIIEASQLGCVEEVATVAAFLTCPDVFLRPRGEESWRYHHTHNRRFKDRQSDAAMYLRIWREYSQHDFSQTWCRWRYLSARSLREVREVREQILEIAAAETTVTSNDSRVAVQKAVASGLIRNLLANTSGAQYTSVLRDIKKVSIHPRSGLWKRHPLFVACAEIHQSGRTYASGVVEVRLEWLPELLPEHFYFQDLPAIVKSKSEDRQVVLRVPNGTDYVCGVVASERRAA